MSKVPGNIIMAVNALLEPYGEAYVPGGDTRGYCGVDVAAKYIGMSESYVYKAVASGALSCRKLGESRNSPVLLSYADLDRFVQGGAEK